MKWALLMGFVIGSAATLFTIGLIRLIIEWTRKRKERKRGYAIDVYEPEPLTPAKKH